MNNATKIYTKTGDEGNTALLSNMRVSKSDIRIVANGAVDELNAWIGLLRDYITDERDKNTLQKIQEELMILGTQLSTPEKTLPKSIHPLGADTIIFLEKEIDSITENLAPLQNFVLPGGHFLISYVHISRCVCRRVEQNIVALSRQQTIDKHILAYINRLSDYLFTLSRKISKELKVTEVKWSAS